MDQQDFLQLLEELLDCLAKDEFELFLVQAWLIWNQRNSIIHGGKLKEPTTEQEGSGLLSRIQLSTGAAGYANHNKH